MTSSVSVVVPVYESGSTLGVLLARLEEVLVEHTSSFEVLLVDDSRSEASWAVIEREVRARRWLRGVRLMRNYGQHSAILCGIQQARYEVVVTLDDDLQHPPEQIPVLLEKLEEGFDVVYGRPEEGRHGVWRDLASRLTKLALSSAMGAGTANQVSAFRALRTDLRESFAGYVGSFVSIDALLTWGTTRFAAIDLPHDARREGQSHYTFRKLVRHAIDMTTAFSTVPLRIASVTGLVFTLFGFAVLVYVVGRYFYEGTSVPGFPFLASIIAIFSGAQLFALGIIGEYLARMHFRTMGRPAYAIRQVLDGSEPRE